MTSMVYRLVAVTCLLCLVATVAISSCTSTITGLTLSSTTYTSSVAGTVIGNLVLGGTNNSSATFSLSGPDAARFQLSNPCTAAACSLQASGTEPDGFHDGRFLVFITPSLPGIRGSGVVYPFTVNETVTCNQTVASGGTQANIATAISAASAGQNVCFADGGTFTIATTVAVNKGVRLTGVNAKTTPAITVSAQVPAFNVSASNAGVDHLRLTGPTITQCNGAGGPPCDSCSLTGSGVIYVSASITGPTVTYNKTDHFWCTYNYGISTAGPTGVVHKYNYDFNTQYTSVIFDHATGAIDANLVSNNLWQDGINGITDFLGNMGGSNCPPGGPYVECNQYPFAISGDVMSFGVTFQNNTATNSPVWHCFDAHGGTDIHYFSNYGLACRDWGNQGVNQGTGFVNMGPQSATISEVRSRINNNVLDNGNITTPDDIIVDESSPGLTINCTGGDLQGCQVKNNTAIGFGATSCAGWIITGANGGTLTTGSGNQVQTVSGNSCTGNAATMAAPTLTTDQPSNSFFAEQANGVIGKISVVMTPAFPAWVGGWPNYGGWPGAFSIGGADAAKFQICVDGQHLCQAAVGTAVGQYNITITGTLTGLSNSPQTSNTITLTGS